MWRSGLALTSANWLVNPTLTPREEAADSSDGGTEVPKKARQVHPPLGTGNGLMLASDAAILDLRGTELVVLSSCLSAMGICYPGEGNICLRSAFAYAGARTVVCSLWKVPDAQTADFMLCFYRALVDGQSRTQALRQAREQLRKRYPHQPRHWSAFVCYGEGGPVSQIRHPHT
jgi:hypothetical protein